MADASGRPVAADERIVALDVLRGFAMFGVLLAYCMWSLGTAPDDSWSPLDQKLGMAVNFVVDGKFYTILAFLFGLGFSIQLGRAVSDAAAVTTYCRRLAALAAIGLVHALLLRNGDILLPYALTGFLMIPFRREPAPVILVAALVALLFPATARLVWLASGIPIPQRPSLANAPYLVENAAWVRYWYTTAILSWPANLTLFLFGLLAGRARLLPYVAERPRLLVRIAILGLLAAVGFFALDRVLGMMIANVAGSFGSLIFTFHCWGLSSCYAAMLLLALRTETGTRILTPLATIGRLALTNYLMQAGVIVPLCLIFGWFDRFTPTTSLLLAIALFALVQLPFSILWVKRFQFGPAEWLWRLLTYGRPPAMRLAHAR